jgi:hypothetical protein
MLAAWGTLLRAFRRFGGRAALAACRAVAREASGGGVVPDNLESSWISPGAHSGVADPELFQRTNVATYNVQVATDN